MVALPKGDWAFTLIRQYLFDCAEKLWLAELAKSSYAPLAERAGKIQREEFYHLRHSSAWVRRLGLGTTESNQRTQTALDVLWGYTSQMFLPLPDDSLLVSAGICPDFATLQPEWERETSRFLTEAGLKMPAIPPLTVNRTEQTHHLTNLLAEMQVVARADPQAVW